MITKSKTGWIAVLSMISTWGAAPAQAETPLEQVSIANAFTPPVGYDDNDTIEVVMDIVMPDPCYVFDSVKFEREENRRIRLEAYARRRDEGVCQSHEFPEETNITQILTVGRLDKGNYTIRYRTQGGAFSSKELNIAAAKELTLDDLNYALVTNIGMNEFYAPTEKIKIKITGRFNPSCEIVDETVKFWLEGDVLIATPTVTKIPGRSCMAAVVKQYSRTLAVGKMRSGSYLVHVRSKHGTSVNRLFKIVWL